MSLVLFLALGCGGSPDEQAHIEEIPDRFTRIVLQEEKATAAAPPMEDMAADDGVALEGRMRQAKKDAKRGGKKRPVTDAEPTDPAANAAGDGGERVRQWFPESFVWQPLVETNADGVAEVDVKVPDQLTTWRLLALAHSQEGGQAGAVHSFDSSLPLYVEPVVPGWLYAGDTVELPIQVVNSTPDPVVARLDVTAAGAASGGGLGVVELPGWGSTVRSVPLAIEGAGTARFSAVLQGADAVVRRIPVVPTGRPIQRMRGGTVASTRTFAIAPPKGVDPATEDLEVRVFAGPLAVLQAELERAGQTRDGAYGFALTSRYQDMAEATQVEVDANALRRAQLVAWQRIVRAARSPDAGRAADLALALAGVDDHELAKALHGRMVRTVVQGQRGDGSWARQDRAPLQQVIVQTAVAARALPTTEEGPRLRASGALERYARDVRDPYTAAVALASGVVSGTLAERMRATLLEGIEETDAGRTIVVPPEVRNAWGFHPSRAEVLAWATLALQDQDIEWRGDLVSRLMSGYDVRYGFGAGPADVIALEAVATELPGLPQTAEIVLAIDGVEVDRASVDPAQPKVPAVLHGAPEGGTGALTLSVEPAVPGLAFTAIRHSWVPWQATDRLAGVEVETSVPALQLGRDGLVTVTLAAPSNVALDIELGLPAGAWVDEAALRNIDGVEMVDVSTDRVSFTTRAFGAGELMEIPIRVRPAFAGRFHTVPVGVREHRRDKTRDWTQLPPPVWTVRAGGGRG